MPRDSKLLSLNENVKSLNLLKETNIYVEVAEIYSRNENSLHDCQKGKRNSL
jgi:hypothetical protein